MKAYIADEYIFHCCIAKDQCKEELHFCSLKVAFARFNGRKLYRHVSEQILGLNVCDAVQEAVYFFGNQKIYLKTPNKT